MLKYRPCVMKSATAAIVLALMIAASGCTPIGAVAYKIMGPEKVPAKFVPRPAPVVVLVEDYHRSTALTDDEMISRVVEQQLQGKLKKTPIVDSSKIRDMQVNEPEKLKTMSVADVGKAVGADQVIWVEVIDRNFESLLGGEQLRGDVAARVKMVDSKTGDTLWPTDMAEGYPVSASMSWGTGNAITEVELKNRLYSSLGQKIGKLFYEWQPDYDEPEGFIAK